jgi:hypothetical protein
MDLLVASVGPLTGAVEAIAASLGAGLVIGAFVGGFEVGLLTGKRHKSERDAVTGSYIGGVISLVIPTIDMVVKSFV